jgi:hypothetical protein
MLVDLNTPSITLITFTPTHYCPNKLLFVLITPVAKASSAADHCLASSAVLILNKPAILYPIAC